MWQCSWSQGRGGIGERCCLGSASWRHVVIMATLRTSSNPPTPIGCHIERPHHFLSQTPYSTLCPLCLISYAWCATTRTLVKFYTRVRGGVGCAGRKYTAHLGLRWAAPDAPWCDGLLLARSRGSCGRPARDGSPGAVQTPRTGPPRPAGQRNKLREKKTARRGLLGSPRAPSRP